MTPLAHQLLCQSLMEGYCYLALREAATVMFPFGAVSCPVLITVPPSNERFCPSPTARLPAFKIAPGVPVQKLFRLGS